MREISYKGQEKDGYYTEIVCRTKFFKIPTSIIPPDAVFLRINNPSLDKNDKYWYFHFTHPKFPISEEGAPLPEFKGINTSETIL